MSNSNASEDNVESPSTYGDKGYKDYRKRERRKNIADPEKENLDMVIASSKYAVGGESTEVPASTSKSNDNIIRRKEEKPNKRRL